MEPHPFFVYRKGERIVLAILIGIILIGAGIALRGLYKLGVILS